MVTVLDTYGRHSPAEIRALGAVGTVRYLAPAGSSKIIGRAEYDELRAADIEVALNWEHSADDYTGGYAAGFAFGKEARAQAHALGHPDSRPVYVSIDTSVNFSTLLRAKDYVRGFHDACGPTAVYGTAFLIDQCVAAGYIEFGWQSCSHGFFDNRRVSPHAALVQHCDHPAYDNNDVRLPDWGQVPAPSGPVETPTPPPKPTTIDLTGDDMHLTSFVVPTDGVGKGWLPTVPWNSFVSATVQGSYPPADDYWAPVSVGVQNRNGKALVTVQGGPHDSRVLVFVAHT